MDLIQNNQNVFLSRPRRFGKSLFLDTLRNIDSLNKYEKYFYVHIQDENLLIEELRYNNQYTNIIEFKHISEHRKNIVVNVFLDVTKEDYTSSSVVVNQDQFQILSNDFKVIIRK